METPMKKSDLQIFLKQYNLWSQGMTLTEMKQCRQALENSLNDNSLNENSLSDNSCRRYSSNESAGHLSTSSGSDPSYSCNYNNFSNFRYATRSATRRATLLLSSSPTSSPTGPHFVVRADVHHSMDWSPDRDTMPIEK